jgi:hypothetical protein
MTLTFQQIDPKLGIALEYPPVEIEHSYLEQLLASQQRFEQAQLYTGKLNDWVKQHDLERLMADGKYLIYASGRTGYFADAKTAQLLATEIYRHPSDAIAYGSLPVSKALSSSVKPEQAKILVIDDEGTQRLPLELEQQILQQLGNSSTTQQALRQAVSKLGDCYMLISPEQADAVQAQANTPFQFRASSRQLLGMLKGTCRVSELCRELGVDAVVPLSSAKGHGKTILPGVYEVDQFFLSRKSDAQLRQQKLGIQALVNLPEGTLAEILPRLQEKAEHLAQIQQDPRLLVEHYLRSAQKRQNQVSEVAQGESIRPEQVLKSDWLSEILHGDLTFELLQHDRVQKELEKFVSGEWEDIATGGVYVPQAMAQPHPDLSPGEICIPSLLHGERVAIFRSPVANVAAFDVLTNNVHKIQQQDPEAIAQQGVCYLNASDAKRLVIDFDGDTVALIREAEFPILVQEIIDKNRPEQKPIQVQKEPKIPRPWQAGQTYWQALAAGALDAANNQVAIVANLGMTLESLRWEVDYLPKNQREAHLQQVASHWQGLLTAAVENHLQIPTNAKLRQSGFGPYSFSDQMLSVVQTTRSLASLPTPERQATGLSCLKQVQQILFNTQSLVAGNLQRAVDARKSARPIDEQYHTFAQQLMGYKSHQVMRHKKAAELYRAGNIIPVNTCDPVSSMVAQANQYFAQVQLPVRSRKHFKDLFPPVEAAQFSDAKTVLQRYNDLNRKAVEDLNRSQEDVGPSLKIISASSHRPLVTSNLVKFDPLGTGSIWEAARNTQALDFFVIPNPRPTAKSQFDYLAQISVKGQIQPIGSVSGQALAAQAIQLIGHQRLTIPQARLELLPSADLGVIEDGFKQAHELLERFVATVPPSERSQVAAYLWHHGGQAACLKAFPQEVVHQLQKQTINLTVVGLQFPTNELPGRAWLGETVPIRIALDTKPDSPNYNRAILQCLDNAGDRAWKTLGPLSNDTQQLPIGTEAQATIQAEIATVTTSRGNRLTVRNLEAYDLAGQNWQGTAQMQFQRQGSQVLALVEHEGDWKMLGTLDKDSQKALQQQERQLQQPIIDSGCVLKDVEIKAEASKSAQVILERESIVFPQHWITAPTPKSTLVEQTDLKQRSQPPPSGNADLCARILKTEYIWSAEALSRYLKPGNTYDYLTYERLTTNPQNRPVQRIPMYFTAEIMTKATGIQQSIRPGCEFSDTFSAIAADKRTSTLRQTGQIRAEVGDIVEITGKPGQQLFAKIIGRESFTVPPQGLDFTQVNQRLQDTPEIVSDNFAQTNSKVSDRGTGQTESAQKRPTDHTKHWMDYSASIDSKSPAEVMKAVCDSALRDGVHLKQLCEILHQAPFVQDFASKRGQAEAQTLVQQMVSVATLPVFEAAIAAENFLKRNCTQKPDGAWEHDGKFWLVRHQQDNNLLIADKADGRTILQLQVGRLQYAPQERDRVRLDFLVKNFGQAQRQLATQQPDFPQRRGLRC